MTTDAYSYFESHLAHDTNQPELGIINDVRIPLLDISVLEDRENMLYLSREGQKLYLCDNAIKEDISNSTHTLRQMIVDRVYKYIPNILWGFVEVGTCEVYRIPNTNNKIRIKLIYTANHIVWAMADVYNSMTIISQPLAALMTCELGNTEFELDAIRHQITIRNINQYLGVKQSR